MSGASKVEVTPEAAQRLGEPIEKAREASERMGMFRRVNELEYSLTKAHDALMVISYGLESMADDHATPNNRELSNDDLCMIYGAVNLINGVAEDCDRAREAEAMA